jgi:hypothetical protein
MGGVQGSKASFRLLAGALALVSTLLTCTAFEAALRIRRGGLLNSAPATSEIRMVGGGYPATWHPELGYGLDQIVLRAEELLDRHPVDTLLVSVIRDDVVRCEYAFRFAHKPWFDVEGGSLVLHNVPAPRPEEPPPGDSTAWRRLQRSALLELVIHRLDPPGRAVRGSVRVHRRGAEVSSALVDRLAGAAQEGGHAFLLILAWHPGAEVERLAPLRRRALELGIPVLDLEPVIGRAIDERGGEWSDLFHAILRGGGTQPGHMTPLGNGLVADAIAAQLSRRK